MVLDLPLMYSFTNSNSICTSLPTPAPRFGGNFAISMLTSKSPVDGASVPTSTLNAVWPRFKEKLTDAMLLLPGGLAALFVDANRSVLLWIRLPRLQCDRRFLPAHRTDRANRYIPLKVAAQRIECITRRG